MACVLQIRAELASKEAALLQKEQELMDKDQTLLVLQEEVRAAPGCCVLVFFCWSSLRTLPLGALLPGRRRRRQCG